MDHNLDILSNNLANVSTPGFKGARPSFEAVMAKAQGVDPARAGRQDVTISRMAVDFTQGPVSETGNELDIALSGEGFLSADTDKGVRYTRRGTMQIDPQGRLAIGGSPLRSVGGGHITIPDQAFVSIEEDGAVFADDELVGQIELVTFKNKDGLKPVGGGFFQGNGAQADEQTEILQGFVEGSNVNAVHGMTELIRTTRIFEASQKAIEAHKDMDTKLTGDIARI
jgi:flagellar basal body rod protein FlgG